MAASAAAAPGRSGEIGAATSRFAAACGALSQYVKATDHRMQQARPDPAPVRPLPLMPGADVVVNDGREEQEPEAARPASGAAAQLTIFYGGRVVVLDDCPADRAAALLRLAAGAAGRSHRAEPARGACGELTAAADLPVARKASLQRFMDKRKGRFAARAEPYHRPDAPAQRRDHLALAL